MAKCQRRAAGRWNLPGTANPVNRPFEGTAGVVATRGLGFACFQREHAFHPSPLRRSTSLPIHGRWLSLLIGLALFSRVAFPAEAVTVEARSGRVFVGRVGLRTSQDQLWLRFGGNGAVIDRPLDWSHVSSVEAHGKKYSAAQFRKYVQSREWAEANNPFADEDGDLRPACGPAARAER